MDLAPWLGSLEKKLGKVVKIDFLRRLVLVAVPFLLVAAVWGTYPVWLPMLLNPIGGVAEGMGGDAYGTYGDAYGALNTLFAGMAFAGIVVSIFLQSRELAETRNELQGQKNQLRRQVFENTFFQTLKMLGDAVDTAYYKTQSSSNSHHQGRECINFLCGVLRTYYLNNKDKGSNFVERYEGFYDEMAHRSMGHYFSTLSSVIGYVDDNKFLDLEDGFPVRGFYMDLIRSRLSSDELFLLFYHGLSAKGATKLKPMIERYGFLSGLQDQDKLVDFWIGKYAESAYGDNEAMRAHWRRAQSETASRV